MNRVTVIGMSCGHCVSAVSNALRDLGLKNVSVDLVSGVATFDKTEAVTPEQVSEAVSEAGFEAGAIS